MLIQAAESYLAVRRALGFQLKMEGHFLLSFARFSHQKGIEFVGSKLAVEWAALGSSSAQRARRLGVVTRFARYVRAEDERHEIPPTGPFGSEWRQRPVPFIFSSDDIRSLVETASELGPAGSLRPITFSTLFALLACTGLRVSEAIGLCLHDVTWDGLRIRESKFRKSRLVPLHKTAAVGLQNYLQKRQLVAASTDRVFISIQGEPLRYKNVGATFRTIIRAIRLTASAGRRGPTIHSLRHSFAVKALEACPANRDQITKHMLALSTYLGHGSVAATYWYLQATPNLMMDIAAACQDFMNGGDR